MENIKTTDGMLEALEALKQTEEALSWLCGALRDQATGHPETLAMWNSAETVRRIEQARAVLKKQSEGATYAVAGLAGMAWRDIAASAYKAYVASTERSVYRGLPLKEWENLHPAIQTAWEAAARQVGECVSLVGDALPLGCRAERGKMNIPYTVCGIFLVDPEERSTIPANYNWALFHKWGVRTFIRYVSGEEMTPHEAEAQAIQQMQQLKQEWGIRNPHIVIHAVFPGILDNLREG